MGRIRRVDHGDVRVGIAISDETAFRVYSQMTVLIGRCAIAGIVDLALKICC